MNTIELLEALVEKGEFVKCENCNDYIYRYSIDFREVLRSPNDKYYCGNCKNNVCFCCDCGEEGDIEKGCDFYCSACYEESEEEEEEENA